MKAMTPRSSNLRNTCVFESVFDAGGEVCWSAWTRNFLEQQQRRHLEPELQKRDDVDSCSEDVALGLASTSAVLVHIVRCQWIPSGLYVTMLERDG